ncbi:hypothetical protein TRFO_33073 [Tritrichomonas foetus]|uniref:DUF3447 domain-containing protein n=1 Tax=Tritrichomonas foetus TaxID=1144522 RepID=A0A1J4JRW7_9EUKA|nr:hypothetical protein TRFO_33073 [Tritrichomonas foetus]|eukprot:OHT00252.1 hypothetical protein TRFO_33073 [Tritrichomonas foetus]
MTMNDDDQSLMCDFLQIINIIGEFENKLFLIQRENDLDFLPKIKTFFDAIHLKTNFALYEGILHSLSHISIILNFKGTNNNNPMICIPVLDLLISDYSLKTTFNKSTLYFIFHNNNLLLLHLYQQQIIDISLLERLILSHRYQKDFIYFVPEFYKNDFNFYEQHLKLFRITEDDILTLYGVNEFNIDMFDKKRKEIHSDELIVQIFRQDDLDSFLQYISQYEQLDLKITITPCNEITDETINYSVNISLIDCSILLGALKIFKYLLLNKLKTTEKSMKYAVISGNHEIIHILEEEFKCEFNEDSFYSSIKYHQTEITEYIGNIIKPSTKNFIKLCQIFVETLNFSHLYDDFQTYLLERTKMSLNFEKFLFQLLDECHIYESDSFIITALGTIFFSRKNDFNAMARIPNKYSYTIFHYSCIFGHFELVEFLLKLPEVDVNITNDIWI